MRRRRFHPRVYAGIVERQDGICACGCDEALGALDAPSGRAA